MGDSVDHCCCGGKGGDCDRNDDMFDYLRSIASILVPVVEI